MIFPSFFFFLIIDNVCENATLEFNWKRLKEYKKKISTTIYTYNVLMNQARPEIAVVTFRLIGLRVARLSEGRLRSSNFAQQVAPQVARAHVIVISIHI